MSKKTIKTQGDVSPQLFNSNTVPGGSELVFGFVGAVGVELKKAEDDFQSRLRIIGYQVVKINIAQDIISKSSNPVVGPETEKARIERLMDAGNEMRRSAQDAGVLALGVAAQIKMQRPLGPTVAKGIAYIVHSLKHPDEVRTLREMYPRGFYLVGVFSSRDRRLAHLKNDRRMTEEDAKGLMERDMNEEIDWGQRLIDTFHLSDFFIRLDSDDDRVKNSVWRIVDLLFGSPHITPTFGEYAMFLAFSASLRSGDLSRQVGAVIARDGEILATGANDCPKAGGGLYWPFYNEQTKAIEDVENGRDFTRGIDSNKAEQKVMIDQIVEAIGGNKSKKEGLRKTLSKSSIRDLIEFGRVVHAEMEALLSCARKGISVKDATIYCATFPCHNCAKHLIAAGLKRVVFVEPYLKSKAFKLHSEAISMSYTDEQSETRRGKAVVLFEPFVGVGSRRFFDLFSMNFGLGDNLIRKQKDGAAIKWAPENSKQRVTMVAKSYLEMESEAAQKFEQLAKKL